MAETRSRPPPLTRRKARPGRHRRRLPTPLHLRAEFLDDNLVVPDDDPEFLDERFVMEDDPEGYAGRDGEQVTGADVGFAGPSDPPAPLLHVVRAQPLPPQVDRWRIAYIASVVAATGALAAATTARLIADPAGGEARTSTSGSIEVATNSASAPTSTAASTSTSTANSTPTSTRNSTDPPTESAPPPEAVEAKAAAQFALDKGNPVAAIEQGERSLELDPEDAETWLIVGAAYMQRGNLRKARRCFASCVDVATRGARAECAALMR